MSSRFNLVSVIVRDVTIQVNTSKYRYFCFDTQYFCIRYFFPILTWYRKISTGIESFLCVSSSKKMRKSVNTALTKKRIFERFLKFDVYFRCFICFYFHSNLISFLSVLKLCRLQHLRFGDIL